MEYLQILEENYPINYPMKKTGKLSAKIIMKTDYIRADGTCALYMQLFLNGARKRYPCNISVREKDFDAVKQKVKKSCGSFKDFNLLLEKMLAEVNKIELAYRLSIQVLTLNKLDMEYRNPTSGIDFIQFWEKEMERQKLILKPGTYRQQLSSLNKLKSYATELNFYDITAEYLQDLCGYLKTDLDNKKTTISK